MSPAVLTCAPTFLSVLQPEPFEFLQDKKQMVAQRVASTAAMRVARSFSRQHSALRITQQGSLSKQHQALRALSSLRIGSAHKAMPAQSAGSCPATQHQSSLSTDTAEISNDVDMAVKGPRQSVTAAGLRQLSTKQLSLQLQRSVSITSDGRLVKDAAWAQQQQLQGDEFGAEALEYEEEFQHEVGGFCFRKHSNPWGFHQQFWDVTQIKLLLQSVSLEHVTL